MRLQHRRQSLELLQLLVILGEHLTSITYQFVPILCYFVLILPTGFSDSDMRTDVGGHTTRSVEAVKSRCVEYLIVEF